MRARIPIAVTAVLLTAMVSGPPAHAATRARAVTRGCSTAATSDANGDGRSDALVSVPGKASGAGEVVEMDGSPEGVVGIRAFAQRHDGLPAAQHGAAQFGRDIATGDITGDGCADAAISAPADRADRGAGAAARHGRPAREGAEGPGRVRGVAPRRDFNADGDDELAIGSSDASVSIVPGTRASGLTGTGDLLWDQATPGVPGAKEVGSGFGQRLATGSYGGGAGEGLLVSEPFQHVSTGSVTEFFGGRSRSVGLVKTGSSVITESTAGVPGAAAEYDEFGGLQRTGRQ